MTRRSAFLTIMAIAASLSGVAHAADEAPEIVVPDINAPEIAARTVAQGWYARGDFGYSPWNGDAEPRYTAYAADGSAISTTGFDDARFSKPISFGAGLGYQFNDIFRTDVTADIFRGRLSGSSEIASPCSAAQLAGTSCGFDHRASYRGIGLLANGYADLGTFAGFTPYVGAGVGATHINWGSTTSQAFCIDGVDACSGAAGGSTLGGDQSWRFTYALMAGVSYDLSNSLKLDVGYRYSDIAGGDLFGTGASEAAFGGSAARGDDDGLQRHELRIGLRFGF